MKKPRVPIIARILGLNALLVFMPVASFLSLDTYEKSLLESLENSLVQQGRILSAWLGGDELTARRAGAALEALGKKHTARLRVIDSRGGLLADSSSFQSPPTAGTELPVLASGSSETEKTVETSLVYRFFSWPVRLYRRYLAPPTEPLVSADFYAGGRNFLEGAEVRSAMQGRYGATTRISAGGQVSVTLYSALPVTGQDGGVRGAVLVSQSTFRILASIYRLRLEAGKIFLASLAAATALSILLWLSISRPLKRLGRQARSALSLSGLAEGHFRASAVSDEIDDLAFALREFSSRLGERLEWSEGFAADLAHEIRNPLASIRAAAELLPGTGPEECAELAARITKDVDRANRIVGGLRELSRIESEADQPDTADVSECARNCAERAARSAEARAKGVSVTVSPAADCAAAAIAPGRLVIALGALLDNAVSFSPPGGAVEIRVSRADEPDGPKIAVSVLDRGPGVPPEHLSRVFERFFSFRPEGKAPSESQAFAEHGSAPSELQAFAERSSAPSELRSDGHCGLGLAIVQGIARRALGRAEAANRPDGGARFTLVLPMPR